MTAAIRKPAKSCGRAGWVYWNGEGWTTNKADAQVWREHREAESAARGIRELGLETVTINRLATRADQTDKIVDARARNSIQSTLNAQATYDHVYVTNLRHAARNGLA